MASGHAQPSAWMRRLTYFTEAVCAQISVQDFTAANTSDLNQCRITQVPVAGWQWCRVAASLCLQAGAVPVPEACA